MHTLGSMILAGCGVSGRPLPPGPAPPGAPPAMTVRATPGGLEATVRPPEFDLDGRLVDGPLDIWLFVDQPRCEGVPSAIGQPGRPIPLPFSSPPLSSPGDRHVVRARAARAGRAGPAGAPIELRWRSPPPPPETPLVMIDARGQVSLTWLPPDAPVEQVRVLRDGVMLAQVKASEGTYTDPEPPAGVVVYQLAGLGAGFRTALSAPARVNVPRRRAEPLEATP